MSLSIFSMNMGSLDAAFLRPSWSLFLFVLRDPFLAQAPALRRALFAYNLTPTRGGRFGHYKHLLIPADAILHIPCKST